MLGDPIVYWILQSILLIALLVSGYGIAYKDKDGTNFWKWASPSIIAYGLIHGLRYMRGQDYSHYMGDLEGDRFTEYSEWLYNLWLDIFNNLGLHFSIGFVCYSTFLIFSFLMVIKKIPQVAVWALPLFLLMLPNSENLVRQYIAIPFILLAYWAYLDNRSYKLIILFCFLSWSIHYSALFSIILLALLITLLAKNITMRYPIVWLALYVWLFFYWDISWFSYLTEYLNKLNFEDETGAGHFLSDADRWFSEEGSISLVLGKEYRSIGIINKTVKFLSECAVIWYGFKVISIKKEYSVIYWFTYIAIILKTISADIEIYDRFAQWLFFMMPILYGLILVDVPLKKIEKYAISSVFFILWGIYGFLYEFGKIGYSGCAFIWDAKL